MTVTSIAIRWGNGITSTGSADAQMLAGVRISIKNLAPILSAVIPGHQSAFSALSL